MTRNRILMLILIAAAVCMVSAGVGAADEVNVTFEGHFGGATSACAVSGNYAYLCQGQDLVVLDVSSPASPVELGRVMTSGFVYDVAISGDYAYITEGCNGLVIVDITDKSAPALAGSYDTGYAYDVAVSGDYAYVVDYQNGLVIVDISNKSAPALAGSYDTGYAYDVAVSGDYAYVVAGWDGLVIVDISNKSAPALAGSCDTAGAADAVAVSGDYVYIADGYNGLVIVDITDKSAPALTGSCGTAKYADAVAISDDYAYVSDRDNGLVIVDISNKSAPALAGSYDTGYAYGVTISDDSAYVADRDNGLVIVDITDKSAPALVGGYDTAGYVCGVAASGDYAYVVDYFDGLVIVDISNKSAPVLAGSCNIAGCTHGVAISGDYAYVVDYQNGLVIVDISNKSAPVLVGGYDIAEGAGGVAVSGDYAYVVAGWNGLVIVDVTDKTAPALAGSCDIAGCALDVAISGDYAYVAGRDKGLVIVDISSKSAPVLAGGYDTEDAFDVAVSGDYAYVVDGWNGLVLVIVDISNKSAPVLAGSCDTAEYACGVAVSGGYAYVVGQQDGLVIVNITDKSTPTLAGGYNTAGNADAVAVSGDYAYVADQGNGLLILRTDAPSTGPVHNINKGTDYSTIQAAIDDADIGDEIHVDSGTYTENVDVYKRLTLIGDGADVVTVRAADAGDHVFEVTASWVNISGFVVTGATDWKAGIYLYNTDHCSISWNNASNNQHGICLTRSSNSTLQGNTANSNNWDGIRLEYSSNSTLQGNTANSNNWCGIRLYASSNNTLMENTASNNSAGIFLPYSSNNTLSSNNASNNNQGIGLHSSSNNILESNTASNNYHGIYLNSSSNNAICLNNFINNGHGTHSSHSTNIWNSTEEITYIYNSNTYTNYLGNYWDDYTDVDTDNDGIWDNPYLIDSDNDYHPLVAPYTPPTGPQNKSLLHVEGQPEVYWFQNNRLYWVMDWNVINNMSGVPGWDSVNTLPASEFDPATYPQGPRFITTGAESDGLLIMQVGDYKVYRIENGKKRHITYPDVMDLKGYSFDDVIEVSPAISDMFPLGDPIGIEVDLYFNKKTDSGDISHVSQFTSGETVKSITGTTVVEDYAVETYVRMIKPDGTEKYAYYESVDFSITDPLQFSDTERSLYSGIWHAQTKTWNWDGYTFVGDEMEGVYTWEFWYEDVASGKVLGKDVQGYEFTITTPPIEDTTPPFILIISPIDGKTVFHSNLLLYGTAFDLSGIETLTVNGQDVISVQAFGVVPFYTHVDLKEGLNEITILAKDASENHNEKIEEITVNYYPFNVKIASPNDLDRLIPGESINGEVIGGTSPFEYKWIINEVEHFGTSDYIFSESGKYGVELEVTDDKGYSIKTEEKQIIVSHLNVGTTFGFRPNPNGYQFGNFVRDDYSWEMFRNTYGTDQVELNGKPEPRAEAWYEKNGNFRHAGDSGTCFGISASSLVIYQKDDGNNNYISWDLGVDRYSTLPSWHFFPSFVSTPTDWAEYFQPLQNSAAAVSDKKIYKNPIIVYDELKLRMASVWIEDPMIIGMEWMITDVDGTGHAVVPYKIEESADHRTGKVFIYDSKYPGEEGHFISFDLATNVAKNDEYNEGNDLANVRAIKLSSVQKEKTPLLIPNLDSVTSYGHLLYTDAVGRHYGVSDGEFTEEIPGVTHIIHWGQDECNQFLETYYISDLNLKRELYGIDNGIATVSIFRPNSLVVADVQVSPSSVDELRVPSNGSSVEFISGEGTSLLSLMLDRENTDMARLARINISGIESGNRLQLLFSGDDSNVSMESEGSQKKCNIYLEQIGFNNSSYGYLRDIVIEENSSIRITPLDWNDITNNLIMVEHDIGNDGTIEYTETLPSLDIKPPSSITNLHPTTGTIWINWTWTNPPDLDFNHAMVYLNGTWQTNTSNPFYNATGLSPDASYEICTHTVDTSENVNTTWVNQTTNIAQKGDLNSDGILTPADAAIALRIAASGAHDDAADVSGDGCVTSLDALMILQAAAGRIEL